MTSIKYPRTPHMPFSPGYSYDDEQLNDLAGFDGQEIVVTEKMDGENTTLYTDHWHPRGLENRRRHESRDWMARRWANTAHLMKPGMRVCGENLYAKHSIHYSFLPDWFLGFSVWNQDNDCLSWDATLEVFTELDVKPVPVLYRGPFSFEALTQISGSLNLQKQEGMVARIAGQFPYSKFPIYVAKWVRANHVQTDTKGHWFSQKVTKNDLK